MPISSDVPPGASIELMPEPLASATRPASRAEARASLIASWVATSTSVLVSTSRSKLISPTRPSSDSVLIASASLSTSAGGPRSLSDPSASCWRRSASASTGLVKRRGVRHLRAVGQVGDQVVDGGVVRRLVEGVPLGRRDDHIHAGLVEGVRGAGEQLRLQVRRLLGRDARDRERVGHRLGHGAGEHADTDDRHDPGGDEDRPPPVGGLPDPVEQGCHGRCLPVGGEGLGGAGDSWGYSKAERRASTAALKSSASSRSGCST